MRCAFCGRELGDEFYVCLDNWLQWEHYARMPRDRNRYCSKECFADDWMVLDCTAEDFPEEDE